MPSLPGSALGCVQVPAQGPASLAWRLAQLQNSMHGFTWCQARQAQRQGVCRYQSRGLFLPPPTVGLVDGTWTVMLPPLMLQAAGLQMQLQTSWPSQDDLFDTRRDSSPLVGLYRSHIAAALDRHAPGVDIGRSCACAWPAPADAAADQLA